MKINSTIAAIATPYGSGGVSIIRISGPQAVEIADRVFRASSGKALSDVMTHTIHHGHVTEASGEVLDEVLASVMRAPKSYTGEDTVEINCHGGIVVTNSILSLILQNGASLADRGEFTKRAFLNGKLDLSRAEAVIDVINSKTSLEQHIAVNHLGGKLSDEIDSLRERLIALIGHIQVMIDYPDEDLEPMSDEEFESELKKLYDDSKKLLETSGKGEIVREGIQTAIAGKPNVGKSSLLNLLSGQQRAIVTDVEGTTRDVIEQYVNIGNVTLKLCDTAGIRKTDDEVEAIGVSRSMDYINESDLIIFMADAVCGLDSNDYDVIKSLEGKKVIALINKSESGSAVSEDEIKKYFERYIFFSVKNEKGISELEAHVKELFELGEIENGGNIITNVRHKEALFGAVNSIKSALVTLSDGLSPDMTFIDIEAAISYLGEITGLTVSEEIVDKIFHSFCIGK